MSRCDVRDIRFAPARRGLEETGMLGWVGFQLGSVRIDSVSVRRSRYGEHHLSFPVRTDSNGVEHSIVRPTTQWERERIETAVLSELKRRGDIS